MAISDTTPASSVPLSSLDLTSKLTWVVTGSEVKKSGVTIKENYCPSLERLEVLTPVIFDLILINTVPLFIVFFIKTTG